MQAGRLRAPQARRQLCSETQSQLGVSVAGGWVSAGAGKLPGCVGTETLSKSGQALPRSVAEEQSSRKFT